MSILNSFFFRCNKTQHQQLHGLAYQTAELPAPETIRAPSCSIGCCTVSVNWPELLMCRLARSQRTDRVDTGCARLWVCRTVVHVRFYLRRARAGYKCCHNLMQCSCTQLRSIFLSKFDQFNDQQLLKLLSLDLSFPFRLLQCMLLHGSLGVSGSSSQNVWCHSSRSASFTNIYCSWSRMKWPFICVYATPANTLHWH